MLDLATDPIHRALRKAIPKAPPPLSFRGLFDELTCRSKSQYPSAQEARYHATVQNGIYPGVLFRPYRCPVCRKFHLTTRP